MEEVVAEDQGRLVAGEEVLGDEECLRESLRLGLHGVLDRHAPRSTIAEQPRERLGILGRGDDEDFAKARGHQRGQRVMDHRLVVDGQQLLAHALGDRPQT